MVKHLPTIQETQVQSLGWEDPLEKEMAPHSSTLAWIIPWTEECCRLQFMGSQRVGHNWATSLRSKNHQKVVLNIECFLKEEIKAIGFTLAVFKKLNLMILKCFWRLFGDWIMFCSTQHYYKIYHKGLLVCKNHRRSFYLLLNDLTFIHFMNV